MNILIEEQRLLLPTLLNSNVSFIVIDGDRIYDSINPTPSLSILANNQTTTII